MFNKSVLFITVLLTLTNAADEYYNIISFDGGGLRGIIPGVVLENMEKSAWDYAVSKGYEFPKYPGRDGLFAMKDLFDMTSGTSTGSIIAAGLVYPNPNVTETEGVTVKGKLYRPPGFFATDLLKIYTEKNDQVFLKDKLGWFISIFYVLLFMCFFGGIFYLLGWYRYDNPKVLAAFNDLREALDENQEIRENERMTMMKPIKRDTIQSDDKSEGEGNEVRRGSVAKETADNMASIKQKSKDILSKFMVQYNLDNVMDEQLEAEIEKTNNSLAIAELEYKKSKMKKWLTCALGIFIGFILGIEIPKITNFLFNAKYDRSSLDKLMMEYLGKSTIDQVLSNEVLIVSYEYNSQQPRLYGKYFARSDPNIYNILVGNATAASSSAPTFFDPKVQVTKYNRTEILVDGGVICNNPAYYAYQIKKSFNVETKKTRILSLGTGEKKFTKIDPLQVHLYTFLKMSGEFMMNIDTYAADWALKVLFKSDPKNYIRCQIVTELSMDANSQENIDGLIANGQTMWETNKVKIDKMMQDIIDARYSVSA